MRYAFSQRLCLHLHLAYAHSSRCGQTRTVKYHVIYLVSTVETEGIGQHVIERREKALCHVKVIFTLTVTVAGVRVTPAGATGQLVRVTVSGMLV